MNPIGIVGTGRVASTLARLLSVRGLPIAAISGRSQQARDTLAADINGRAVPIAELAQQASVAIIAVSDDAIPSVARELVAGSGNLEAALHTSGAAGPDALELLRLRGTATGVLHPLQTIPSYEFGMIALPGSAFAYAGETAAAAVAEQLICALDGKPLRIDPERWQHYHAAAVMVSNYQAALVEAALELLESAGVDRETGLSALRPLIEQSTNNIVQSSPRAALTGPIRRGDLGTVLRHIRALRKAPAQVRELYAAAGLQTVILAERAGLPAAEAQQIARALAQASVQ